MKILCMIHDSFILKTTVRNYSVHKFRILFCCIYTNECLAFHLLSSCGAVSRSPTHSSLTLSSLTLSMSTTVDRTFNSVCCSIITELVSEFTLSFLCDVASFVRPVFGSFREWLLRGSGAPFSVRFVCLDLGGRSEFSLEGFSIMEFQELRQKQGA